MSNYRGQNTAFLITPLACCLLVLCPSYVGAVQNAQNKQANPAGGQEAAPMEKYVTKEASFVLYMPKGWTAAEGVQQGFRTLTVTDPSGQFEAAMFYGSSPAGGDLPATAKYLIDQTSRRFGDLSLRTAMKSKEAGRLTFDGVYTDPQRGKREFRCWLSGQAGDFTCLRIDAPQGRLSEKRQLLLTILSNVKVTKGAFKGEDAPAAQVTLVGHQLSDGSASFKIPQGWTVRESGAGQFVATDPSGTSSFISANVTLITPQLGVRPPGVPIAPYMSPHETLQFLTTQAGIASNMKFLGITPRQDLAQQMAQVYTTGPVAVEDFFYTCTTQAGPVKGYTLGISFGSRLGASWSFRHITVAAPQDKFDALAPAFADMFQSYTISNEYAKQYVARGMARLREMQQQTSRIVSRNADEIHEMMQAAYEERQRSGDYIDYQRTNTIRGEQDWVSSIEGGTVYHTDTWGTKNTSTGETWQGQPYDYVHFEGENPKYNEQMTPVDTRELWERHIEQN